MYNGLNVIAKVPGLIEHLDAYPRKEWHFYSTLHEDLGFLGDLTHSLRHEGPHGYGTASLLRQTLQQRLVSFAEKNGIEVKWGHQLESLEQSEDSVSLKFANGAEDVFSFVVGCDGLHSNTRQCLFGKVPADYTGLAQACSYVSSGNPCANIQSIGGWILAYT